MGGLLCVACRHKAGCFQYSSSCRECGSPGSGDICSLVRTIQFAVANYCGPTQFFSSKFQIHVQTGSVPFFGTGRGQGVCVFKLFSSNCVARTRWVLGRPDQVVDPLSQEKYFVLTICKKQLKTIGEEFAHLCPHVSEWFGLLDW